MSEWRETSIGGILSLEYGKALPERVRDGGSFPVFGSNGAVGSHSKPLVRGPGIVVGRKGTAGSVEWVGTDFFPIDTTYFVRVHATDVSLEFAYLLLQNANLPAVCAQTGVPGLNRDRAYGIRTSVPPSDVQRRIVDVIASFDHLLARMQDEIEAMSRLMEQHVTRAMSSLSETKRLGDIAETRSGPSYSASDVSAEPEPGTTPVIGIPNTRPDGTVDLSDVGYVRGLSDSVRTVGEESLVLIRTNGNRQRIGNVYLPPLGAKGHAVSAFQFLMNLKDPEDRAFVFWALREQGMQARMSEAASGTTGLGNLAVKWLNARDIPWSTDTARRSAIAADLDSQLVLLHALRDERERLAAARSRLLASLMERTAETPDSYDSPSRREVLA